MRSKTPKNTSTPRKNANNSQESSNQKEMKISRMLKQLNSTFNFEEMKTIIGEKTVTTRSRLKILNKTDSYMPNIKNDTVGEKKQSIVSETKDVSDSLKSTQLNKSTDMHELPSLRRSGRAKIDKSSKPIYKYEAVKDCFGKSIMVSKVIGTRSGQDSFSHFLQEIFIKKEKTEKKQKILQRIAKRKANNTM
jgi:hypothetical protein